LSCLRSGAADQLYPGTGAGQLGDYVFVPAVEEIGAVNLSDTVGDQAGEDEG
jgi:hypothetical protein